MTAPDWRPVRLLIMGAAGRDFHNFNVLYRDNPAVEVVAFTAAQIPDIAGRRYPPALAGPRYPDGIPILAEEDLASLIRDARIDRVELAYSDLAHVDVMHKASITLAAGADFALRGPHATMLPAARPVIAVCAVRTGAGKSPLSRFVVRRLLARGRRAVAMRHPMPYGDLVRQAVQRFATYADLDAAEATIEEREEYEPYIEMGAVVFTGVDYARVLAAAEPEADVIVWDGGNNDFPFLRPDLHIVLLDARRPGHELLYHPGEANLRMADALVISKVDSADPMAVRELEATALRVRPGAPVILGELSVAVDRPELIAGRRVVVVGDGPTLTHGGMASGAGALVAQIHAAAIVDARPYAVGSIADAYRAYPHLGVEVPALGYSRRQVADLEATLRAVPADAVVDASPVNLGRLLALDKPIARVTYEFQERGDTLATLLDAFASQRLDRR